MIALLLTILFIIDWKLGSRIESCVGSRVG
jgi:hypothetical protein